MNSAEITIPFYKWSRNQFVRSRAVLRQMAVWLLLSGSLGIKGLYAQDAHPLVSRDWVPSVIIPAETLRSERRMHGRYIDYWTPSVVEVARAEAAIEKYLSMPVRAEPKDNAGDRDYVREHKADYIGQYFGAVTKRGKIIHFRATVLYAVGGLDGIWRKRLAFTYDWPQAEWDVDYHPEDGSCDQFYIESGY